MIRLIVNGRDLSSYTNVQEDSGLDPVNAERVAPQFTGIPALQEGQTYIGSAVANREMNVPMVLSASDRASLHQLIRDITNDLVQGAQVEFAHDPTVDSSTFLYLERGRLDVEYQYFLANAATLRATLHLWTRPHGSTGTMRIIASLTATGPKQFAATGILGDTYALANFEVRVGSAVASAGRVIGFGIHSSASFNGIRQASLTGIDAGQASSTVVGASGGIGSSYVAIPISPTGASGISFTSYLTPPGGHVGRHRVFAVARSGLNVPITMYAADRFGAVLGPTAQATQIDQAKWQLIDLGEVQVPARASGQEAIPTQYVNIYAGGASGAGISASPAFHLDNLIYLPLDISPGLLRTQGAGGQTTLYQDNFARLGGGAFLSVFSTPNAVPGPGVWTRLLNDLGETRSTADGDITIYSGGNAVANATAAAGIGSGANLTDAYESIDVQIANAVGATAASGALVELWAKSLGQASGFVPSAYIGARMQLSPSANQHVALISASAGNVAVVASAALTASVASAVMGGLKHTLAYQVNGASAQLFLATTMAPGQAAIVSGSNALHTIGGNPGIYMRTPSYAANGALFFDNFLARSITGSAPDTSARETFRFEGWPQLRAFQGNASVYTADRAGNFRGVPPRLPPTGSPGASGPMQVVAFQGEVDNLLGNDSIDLNLAAMERFVYLR